METSQIIVSTRLKNNPVARYLAELGTDIRYSALRRGEFLLADRFGISYLTSEQFVAAIQTRRIYRDVVELRRHYDNPVIIIEGKNPIHDARVGLSAIHGALLFITVLNTIPILFTTDESETAQMLFMLTMQAESSIDWKLAAGKQKPPPDEKEPADDKETPVNPRLSIIATLPEMGEATAVSLLDHFGSLASLFAASISELKKVQGIGPKRAKKIYDFMHGKKVA